MKQYDLSLLPENDTLRAIPSAMAKAWELYNNKNAVVMMIVHPNETNTFDQRWIEYNLWNTYPYNIPIDIFKELFVIIILLIAFYLWFISLTC